MINKKITSLTKCQLLEIHSVLAKEEMLPIVGINIFLDPRYSTDKINYYRFIFASEDKEIDTCFITHHEINIEKLHKQLMCYYG